MALYRSGRQADALRAYERTRSHLADEWASTPVPGWPASPPRSSTRTPPSTTSPSPTTPPPPWNSGSRCPEPGTYSPSFVRVPGGGRRRCRASAVPRHHLRGRVAEGDALGAVWAQVEAGDGRLAVLAGEAGMGKTRLAQEVVLGSTSGGGHVLWGRCTA